MPTAHCLFRWQMEACLPDLVAEGATAAERTVGTLRNLMNEFTDLRNYPRPTRYVPAKAARPLPAASLHFPRP